MLVCCFFTVFLKILCDPKYVFLILLAIAQSRVILYTCSIFVTVYKLSIHTVSPHPPDKFWRACWNFLVWHMVFLHLRACLLQIKVYIPLAVPFRCKATRYVCLLLNNCLHWHVLIAKGTSRSSTVLAAGMSNLISSHKYFIIEKTLKISQLKLWTDPSYSRYES